MIKSWSYKKEYKDLRGQILKKIDQTLKSGNIFFGKQLGIFEKNFIKENNLKFGTAVGSGTEALYISLLALNIGKGDEVITVSNTAIATVSAIESTGAKARFIDVRKDYLMDVSKIQKAITKNTKAIIPVHLFGQSCEIDKICKIAKKNRLKVIEDCAQAQGAKYKNKFVGTFGDISCFSFYPTKILGAYGDGGFVGSKNKLLIEKVKRIRLYGMDKINKKNKFFNKYYSNEHGINSRIDEIQCSILNLKLKKVKSFIIKRRKIANIYKKNLYKTSLVLPPENKNCEHVYHLFVVYHKKRNLIFKKLKKYNIYPNINYEYPIHLMKAYKSKISKSRGLSNSEKFAKGIFSLPIYPNLEPKNISRFIGILKKILKTI